MYKIEVNDKITEYDHSSFVEQKFTLMCNETTFKAFYPSGYTAVFKPNV